MTIEHELILLSQSLQRATRLARLQGDHELVESLRKMAWATASLLAKVARRQLVIDVVQS